MKRLLLAALAFSATLVACDYRVVREILDDYPFKGDERVIDIGCGTGATTAAIAQQVPDGFALGIDPWANNIECAEMTYDTELFANLQFYLGLTFDGPTLFDLATSFGELDTAPLESLRPGGKLLACVSLSEAATALTAVQGAGLELIRLQQIENTRLKIEAIKPAT